MESPTILAADPGGSIPSLLTLVLVVAGIAYVLWRRLQGEPLQARRLLVPPLLFGALGLTDLTGSGAPRLGPASVAFLAAGAALSFVLGAARGATIELSSRQGQLWQRYRGVTVVLWGVLIASKLLLALVAHLAGAPDSTDLLLSLGLSLAGEAALVAPRALSTGVPFAPGRERPSGDRRGRRGAAGLAGPGSSEGWDNGGAMHAASSPSRRAAAFAGRSPTWREGLAWMRSQLEQAARDDGSR